MGRDAPAWLYSIASDSEDATLSANGLHGTRPADRGLEGIGPHMSATAEGSPPCRKRPTATVQLRGQVKGGSWSRSRFGHSAAMERKTKRYPTDFTDEEWQRVSPLLPDAGEAGQAKHAHAGGPERNLVHDANWP